VRSQLQQMTMGIRMNSASDNLSPLISEYNYGLVQEVRLARPPVNAFNGGLVQQLTERLRMIPLEGKRAVVLSGPEGIFSGGYDIKSLRSMDREDVKRFVRGYLELQYIIAVSPIPIIAAITGHCAAGGTSLALFCDYRVMARGEYRIGMNEVQFGLCVGKIIHAALRRLVGSRHSDQLLTSAAMLPAEKALEVGLVDAAVELDRVVIEAQDYAAALTRLPPKAFKATRQIVRADLVKLFDGKARQDATDEMVEAILTEESQAALRAFVARGR
jgi:enoyl-CoA hydratase/carnithine racemase